MFAHQKPVPMFLRFVILTVLLGKPPATHAADLETAKNEGSVVIYGAVNVADMQQLTKLFNQKFPYIKVDYLRNPTGKATYEKILMEVRAKRYTADIYQIAGLQAWMLGQRGLLFRYESAERPAIHEALKDSEGYWTGFFRNTHVTAFNTRLVRPGEVPHSYQELLLSRWKGKLSLDQEAYEWFGSMMQIMGRQKALEFMRNLSKQDLQYSRSPGLGVQLLCAGEFAIDVVNRVNLLEGIKEKGCPADWVAIEPLIQRPPTAIAIAKVAPHPEAAKIFLDFMLSREAQQFLSTVLKRESARTDVELPIKGMQSLRVWKTDWDQIFRDYDGIIKLFREIFPVS